MYAGGLRLRLIADNFENMLRTSLDDLGWFDSGRKHKDVVLISKPLNPDEEIKPNMIGISAEDRYGIGWELGSEFEETTWEFYIDIFAESNSVGVHLAGDVLDICKGKLSSIGRDRPNLEVLDLTMATPTTLFYCNFDTIEMARQRVWNKPHQQFWWTVLVEVVDAYYDEGED